jgi:D-3-phosphoglycerate dehydrogenase / 2-oxoglutarate reductase
LINVAIVDCNHGFFEPEVAESDRLGIRLHLSLCSVEDFIKNFHYVDAIVVQRTLVDKVLLQQLPNCKVVTRYGVGLDNVKCDELRELNVKVINFPTFCTEEVANHALSLILFLYRQLDVIHQDKQNLAKQWGNPDIVHSIQNANNTQIGLIGLGKIGSQVAKRLLACGFKVMAYDPYVDNFDPLIELCDSLETLFITSDIVSVHCPLTDETKGMVDKTLLSLMPTGSCVVNTARGPIVVTDDLVAALRSNLRAAYIDVIDPEPPPVEILEIPNLYITHHCAFYSAQSLLNLKQDVIRATVKALQCMVS